MNEMQIKDGWDFEVEVVETRALWERWKGIALTWRSATVDLGRKLWMAHKALGGDHTRGRKKLSSDNKKLSSDNNMSDFVEAVGIPSKTFYRFIERIDKMIAEGVDIGALPADMKLVEAAAPKSQAEIELEEKITKNEEEIEGRDRAIATLKRNVIEEKDRLKIARLELEKLKTASEKEGKPDPALQKRIAELEKQENKLSEEVGWLSTAVSFKTELQALIDSAMEVSTLGKRILQSKRRK